MLLVGKFAIEYGIISERKFSVLLTKGVGVFGSLGQSEDLLDSKNFKTVTTGQELSKISAGWGHSAALTKQGEVFIFGRPFEFGTLMRINAVYAFMPFLARKISRSTNSDVYNTYINYFLQYLKHIPALKIEDSDLIDRLGFFPLPVKVEVAEKISSVVCSAGLTLMLSEGGNLYSLGLNRWGQCGMYDPSIKTTESLLTLESKGKQHVYAPIHVTTLPPAIIDFDAGLQHGVALSSEGSVYTWGKAGRGQLGIGEMEESSYPPSMVKFKATSDPDPSSPLLQMKKVSAGFGHTAAISTDGDVYVWGKGMSDKPKEGRFGVKVFEDQLTPRLVSIPDGRKAVDICSSNFSLVVLASDGSLWVMGFGEYDRNCNPYLLRVQTDFHKYKDDLPSSNSSSTTTTIHPSSADQSTQQQQQQQQQQQEFETVYLRVPATARLKKGYARVSLLFSPSDNPDVVNGDYHCYDIVLHNGEAYLIEIDVDRCPAVREQLGRAHYRVADYSAGWKHSLLIAEPTQ